MPSHGFLAMQKNLAFRIVKANRTVLKDILCEVLHLGKKLSKASKAFSGPFAKSGHLSDC